MSRSGPPDGVGPSANEIGSKELRRSLTEMLGWGTKLAFFPVRHHSPTCARHLAAYLEEHEPDVVLIEGPAAYNERIDILSDAEHVTPFALVAVARQDKEVVGRAYYPFCDYSPELVALRWASANKKKARFIDLVYGERGDAIGRDDDDGEGENEARAPVDQERRDADEHLGAAEDDQLSESSFTRAIVAKAGCRDFDELWEALFEQAGWKKKPLEWAVDVMAYACLARESTTDARMKRDGTFAREACMAEHIAEVDRQTADRQTADRQTEKRGGKKVLVVTGAFHSVALAQRARNAPAEQRAAPKRAKKPKHPVETEVFLAPYTFPRLDALLGYASGMSGPEFYQRVWEARKGKDPFGTAAQEILVGASRLARKDGEVLGTADAIQAMAFARALASFRGRPFVGRVELIEAATTCYVKGDSTLLGQRVLRALGEVMRGSRVGKLGASAGQSPLVLDFQRRLKELRLPLEHGRPQPQELAIFASELALERSRFFHQCRFLELGFAAWQRGPNLKTGEDLDLTVEHWTVQYVPEIETKLAELSHLGATVHDVAAAALVKAILVSEGKSGPLADHLLDALVMGLHRPMERLVPRLAASMFADDDVLSLISAGNLLRTVLRGRERLEGSLVEGLPQLAQQAYLQGTLRLERLAGMQPDALPKVLAALAGLLDVVLVDPAIAPPRDLLIAHAVAARDVARGKAPALLGAMDGFLFQLGETDAAAMAKNFAASRGRPDALGSYLEGVLAVARQALLGGSALLGPFLDHLRDADWEDFLATLPSLRRALTRLSPRETAALAAEAAAILGLTGTCATELLGASPEIVAKLAEWEKSFVAGEARWAAPPSASPSAGGAS
jgi:Family of unknown function (DUF5682)